jgi:hypothetical protein
MSLQATAEHMLHYQAMLKHIGNTTAIGNSVLLALVVNRCCNHHVTVVVSPTMLRFRPSSPIKAARTTSRTRSSLLARIHIRMKVLTAKLASLGNCCHNLKIRLLPVSKTREISPPFGKNGIPVAVSITAPTREVCEAPVSLTRMM